MSNSGIPLCIKEPLSGEMSDMKMAVDNTSDYMRDY